MLSERERQISTEITQLQSQQRTEAVRETTTHIIDLSNEESTLRDLRQKYRDKDREVESHCCGLWACNRVDIIDRADMKHQVDEAQAEIDRKRKAALRDAPKSPLDQQISDLEEALQNKRRRRFELDIVITNQCIASKSKQAELTRIEQEIAGLEQSLLQLKQQRLQPVKPSIDPRLETLTIELRSIQQQHREHVLNFPEKIKEAQQLQDNIMAKFEEKKLTEDSQEVFYNASINIASMLTILRIYVQWQAFTQQIESLFGTLRREVMDEQDALFQEITRLHVVIMTQKNNIDACFHYLWCFESRDQSLETLSIAYYRLDTATQQDLLTDQPKQTSIDGLLPVDRGLRLHQLKEHAPTTISPAPACLLESLRAKEHSMAYATALLTP
ncbi:MAG: hypothetical protein ACD_45C00308G0002 [uncultured bacterium]|nr:MAG: hypothetical protein ACD_45C00308G0002 [uncultured bacterium]